jgi:hypothetical protein
MISAMSMGVQTLGSCGVSADVSPRRSLPPERLLRGQQAVLEMVASGRPLDQSLRANAEFSESCLPEMMACILYYNPIDRCLRRGGYGRAARELPGGGGWAGARAQKRQLWHVRLPGFQGDQ